MHCANNKYNNIIVFIMTPKFIHLPVQRVEIEALD